MECYNLSCTEECDEFKKMSCLFRESKEVHELKTSLDTNCSRCGKRTVKAKLKKNKKQIILCTECKNIEVR